MAVQTYASNSPETVELFSKALTVEAIRATYFDKFQGTSMNDMIMVCNDAQKGPGDTITNYLAGNITMDGALGDEALEGNETAPETFTDQLTINELRGAVRVKAQKSIEQQRVPFDMGMNAMDQLANWWAERLDIAMFNQLAGNTAQTNLRYVGQNATTAPTSGRYLRVDDSAATGFTTTVETSGNIDTADTMRLSILDHAKNRMIQKTSSGAPRIRPLKINGKSFYVAFLHPNQCNDLRTDVERVGNWFDLHSQTLAGGEIENNPIFSGAMGVYNGIILHECESIPNGADGTTVVANTRRAVICGAQAAHIGWGQDYDAAAFDWVEDTFDYKKELGVKAGSIFGIKKTVWNSHDYGAFVVSSYAADV